MDEIGDLSRNNENKIQRLLFARGVGNIQTHVNENIQIDGKFHINVLLAKRKNENRLVSVMDCCCCCCCVGGCRLVTHDS